MEGLLGEFHKWGRQVRQLAFVAVGTFAVLVLLAPRHADAAPAACAALKKKYPDWKGKTLVNAINPHTPGYEAIDPNDPNKHVGLDIDLGEEIGDCLGFKVTYKAVTFAALLTTLASGQADIDLARQGDWQLAFQWEMRVVALSLTGEGAYGRRAALGGFEEPLVIAPEGLARYFVEHA